MLWIQQSNSHAIAFLQGREYMPQSHFPSIGERPPQVDPVQRQLDSARLLLDHDVELHSRKPARRHGELAPREVVALLEVAVVSGRTNCSKRTMPSLPAPGLPASKIIAIGNSQAPPCTEFSPSARASFGLLSSILTRHSGFPMTAISPSLSSSMLFIPQKLQFSMRIPWVKEESVTMEGADPVMYPPQEVSVNRTLCLTTGFPF